MHIYSFWFCILHESLSSRLLCGPLGREARWSVDVHSSFGAGGGDVNNAWTTWARRHVTHLAGPQSGDRCGADRPPPKLSSDRACRHTGRCLYTSNNHNKVFFKYITSYRLGIEPEMRFSAVHKSTTRGGITRVSFHFNVKIQKKIDFMAHLQLLQVAQRAAQYLKLV